MNTKQERKQRRQTMRVLVALSKVVEEQIGPMIKDECRSDFLENHQGSEGRHGQSNEATEAGAMAAQPGLIDNHKGVIGGG